MIPNSFAQRIAEDRRLSILRLLVEAGGSANESILRDGLELLGLSAGLTRDVVRADLAFLDQRGLIRQEWFQDRLVVAHVKKRGVETAEGKLRVDGISRPSVGE